MSAYAYPNITHHRDGTKTVAITIGPGIQQDHIKVWPSDGCLRNFTMPIEEADKLVEVVSDAIKRGYEALGAERRLALREGE